MTQTSTEPKVDKAPKTRTYVFSYGIHYSWSKQIPEVVNEQLFLAHVMREELVTINNEREEVVSQIWRKYPQIVEIEDHIFEVATKLSEVREELANERMIQRTNNISGPKVKDLRDKEKTLIAERTALKKRLKQEKETLKETHPEIVEAFIQNKTDEVDKIKELNREMAKRGLYHATAYETRNAHMTAVKNINRLRELGQKAELRHHRYEGTGLLGVQLSGRGGINKRNPLEISDVNGPHKNVLIIPYLDPKTWDNKTTSQKVHEGRVIARMRVGGNNTPKEDKIIEIPIQMHRPLPENSEIKSATLVVKKKGLQNVATLNLKVTVPEPKMVEDLSTVSVHFGWRKEKDKSVRAMTWLANAPLTLWDDLIKGNPNYPALNQNFHISDDRRYGTLTIPEVWIDRIKTSDELRSITDNGINEVRKHLIDFLDTVGPINHPTRTDHETGWPELLSVENVKKWKSPSRFAQLALGWRNDPPPVPGGADIAEILEDWRKANKKITMIHENTSRKVRNRRDDLYAQVAALLVDSYGQIVTNKMDQAELALLPKKDVTNTNDMVRAMNRQRANTAAGTLKEKIKNTASREGVRYKEVDYLAVSTECLKCGHRNIRPKGKMIIDCEVCQNRYDIDDNAVEMISIESI